MAGYKFYKLGEEFKGVDVLWNKDTSRIHKIRGPKS